SLRSHVADVANIVSHDRWKRIHKDAGRGDPGRRIGKVHAFDAKRVTWSCDNDPHIRASTVQVKEDGLERWRRRSQRHRGVKEPARDVNLVAGSLTSVKRIGYSTEVSLPINV